MDALPVLLSPMRSQLSSKRTLEQELKIDKCSLDDYVLPEDKEVEGPAVHFTDSVTSQRTVKSENGESQHFGAPVSVKFSTKIMRHCINGEIKNRYDISNAEIGVGGCGRVFVATDKGMNGRKVAIKQVLISNGERLEAFKREAEIMKVLDHPNICKLLETYQQGRFMYFVMELLEGRELFDRIIERGYIQEDTTADIVQQITSALKYAHDRGIAHRDIKPENVIFCSADVMDNNVKVIDWGLGFYFGQAKMVSEVGTLSYAAPEVLGKTQACFSASSYTAACDVWSLGVLTYVMLCGRPPFWGNMKEQIVAMKKERYPMSGDTWQAMSKDGVHFIKSLLKANPRKRPSLDLILEHPWLHTTSAGLNHELASQVLTNLRHFSHTSQFFSMCVANVARQLDHQSLRDVHKVFCELDTNKDGVLELSEVIRGFGKVFHKDSNEMQEVKEMFARLDLDGSGTIDYTEFCAAGLGERKCLEEETLWCAFKTFDIQDDDERITKAEICSILRSSDVNKVWTPRICQQVAEEIFAFDGNGDGSIDFQEFVLMMRECAKKHQQEHSIPKQCPERQKTLAELDNMVNQLRPCISRAYTLLHKLEHLDRNIESRNRSWFCCFSKPPYEPTIAI